ncbi:MAG: hypothetical protein QW292_05825 [Candidatus Parvarchaeota archaeon]
MKLFKRKNKNDKTEEPLGQEAEWEERSKDMGTSPEGEYYSDVNWLALFVFFVIVILILNVAFLYPSIIPAAFYSMELQISAFLWQRLTILPLWAGLLILLFAWGPFTILKPVLVYEGKNHWYFKVRGPDRGLVSFYLFRNLGRQPVVVYKAYLRHRGLSYYVEASDLIIEPGKRPSLIVIEGLSTGEVREILALERENRELKIENQKLWRELRLRHAPSVDLVMQTLLLSKGGGGSNEPPEKK